MTAPTMARTRREVGKTRRSGMRRLVTVAVAVVTLSVAARASPTVVQA